jgi:integrase
MPTIKYTEKGLEALLRQRHAERVDYFDAVTPALCLRVGPTGATWYYFKRIDGKLHRLNLGTYAALASAGRASFSVAREKAGEIEAAIVAGKHPKAEQARQRAADRDARAADHARLVKHVAAAWSAQHLPTVAASTRADYSRELAEFVAAFGDSDIGKIKRGAILRHLDSAKARSPSGTAANRAAVVIRQLFAFARDRYDLDANPVADVRNPTRQTKRSRTLDRNEIRVLWRACELAGYPYGHALRFALCTGQRIGEVGGIRRSDIDSTGDYWQQVENKSSQRIDLFLAAHSKRILASCPDYGRRAPFFCASFDRDHVPRPLRSYAWNVALLRHIQPRIAEAAAELGLEPIVKPWTPHDLRRTVRTALTGWCAVSPDTAERVLNHAIGGLRAVYDHADYRPHVADALQRWDKELATILKGSPSQIVSLSDRKREKRRSKVR